MRTWDRKAYRHQRNTAVFNNGTVALLICRVPKSFTMVGGNGEWCLIQKIFRFLNKGLNSVEAFTGHIYPPFLCWHIESVLAIVESSLQHWHCSHYLSKIQAFVWTLTCMVLYSCCIKICFRMNTMHFSMFCNLLIFNIFCI